MGRRLAILLALLAPACGAEEDPPPPPDGELQAGSAALDGTGFVDVTDGQEVELVPGAQGGFHVWLNVRVHGTAGELYVKHDARLVATDELVLRGLLQPIDVPDDAMDDWWESPAAGPAFMCPSPIGIQVFDQEIRYTVQLVDEDEAVLAEDSVVLLPRCPEGDQNAFCLEICAG